MRHRVEQVLACLRLAEKGLWQQQQRSEYEGIAEKSVMQKYAPENVKRFTFSRFSYLVGKRDYLSYRPISDPEKWNREF